MAQVSVQIHDPIRDNPPSNQHIMPLPSETFGHLTMQNTFIPSSKVPIVFQSPSIIQKSQISCCEDLVHLCEVAAGETPMLTMANEKPKEGVKTENNEHIDASCSGAGRLHGAALNEEADTAQWTNESPLWTTEFANEADQVPVWWANWNRHTCIVGNGGWRSEGCVPAADRRCLPKREVATSSQNFVINQETFSIRKLQFGPRTPWPPHCTFLCSFVSLSPFFLELKIPGVLHQHVAVFPFGWHQMGKGWEGSGSMKASPLSTSGTLTQLFSVQFRKLFCSHCFNKRTQQHKPLHPFFSWRMSMFSFITKPRTICNLSLCSCYM